MVKNKVDLSLQEEMESVSEAIRKVTAAKFSNTPGVAPTIKAKRKSAQVSFRISGANDKRSLQSRARREILRKIFKGRAAEVEIAVKTAMKAVVAGLIGAGNSNVRVFNRSLGNAKPKRRLKDEPFFKFIKSKAGAGEIGLPDPDESLRNLKAALLAAITVDVVVREAGPQIKFSFDQTRLLKLTPHPHQFESGKGPFFSWLSLVTGPQFARGGTPGYSLVRVSDLRNSLKNSQSAAQGDKTGLRRVNITESLIRSSRTRGNAGELAGIMMRNRGRGKTSPAEAFGGQTEDYQPNARFDGFWDEWWMHNKLELSTWSRRVMSATARALLRG